MKNTVAVAILLIAAAAAGYILQLQLAEEQPVQRAEGELNHETIEFSLPDLDGVQRNLSDWHGEARIVNFWATWCAPCRREIPLLKELQADMASSGLQVIGIAVDYPEDVAAYAEAADFNYPILVGQEEAMAAAEASGIDFIGLPFTLVLASSGELVAAHMGEIRQEHIEKIVGVMRALESGNTDLDSARESLHMM